MIDIIPVDLIVHKNQAVPDILRVIFLVVSVKLVLSLRLSSTKTEGVC